MTSATAHPTSIGPARQQLASTFVRITHDSPPDPNWQFQLALPRTTQMAPAPAHAPSPGKGLLPLALFHLPDPPADIEVLGEFLSSELDPADYLDLWLDSIAVTPLSRKRLPTLAGAVGDVVGHWTFENAPYTGRFFCLKAGPRLAILAFRTAHEHYPALAEHFFLTLSTFQFVNDPFGPLAEKIQWLGNAAPTPWKLALPISWTVQPEPAQSHVASFQAALLSRDPASPGTILGKLSFAIVAPDQLRTPADGLAKALAAVSDANLQPGPTTTIEEPPNAPYTESAYFLAPLEILHRPAEFRCRILRHPKAWIIATVITPARAASTPLWLHNKRVLDIATATLEIA